MCRIIESLDSEEGVFFVRGEFGKYRVHAADAEAALYVIRNIERKIRAELRRIVQIKADEEDIETVRVIYSPIEGVKVFEVIKNFRAVIWFVRFRGTISYFNTKGEAFAEADKMAAELDPPPPSLGL